MMKDGAEEEENSERKKEKLLPAQEEESLTAEEISLISLSLSDCHNEK